jgi:gliding motility-associated-like protein
MEKTALKQSHIIAVFLFLAMQAFSQNEAGNQSAGKLSPASMNCDFGDFSLPNAFTPNGDGANDAFCLQGWDKCIEKFSILIFDRLGEKVFESGDPSFCWDGTCKGIMVEPDVLVYTVRASFTNGLSVNKNGNITLMR